MCAKKNKYYLLILGLFLIIPIQGCQQERKETTTKGHVIVAVSESVFPLIREEKQRFEELYPEAKVELVSMTAREAITRLFNDTIKVIVSSRPFNGEEREVIKRYKLEINEYSIAIDGIAIIVNDKNPIMRLRTTQLDSIFKGTIKEWGAFGGRKVSIEICLPDPNSDAFEVVGMKLLGGGKYATPNKVATSAKELLEFVSNRPNVISMIGLNWLNEKKNNVKVLELSDPNAPDSLKIKDQYFAPFQAHVYRGFYPLTTNVYIYSRADMFSVGAGFISFVASAPGQKIVLNNGLVPATMPVRLVQLTNKGM